MKMRLLLSAGVLRPTTADDLEAVLGLCRDEQVRAYLFDGVSIDRAKAIGLLEQSDQLGVHGLGLWAIEQQTVEPFAGIVGLQPVPEEPVPPLEMKGGIELIIALRPAFWGQGLAREACRVLLDYAHSHLGLTRLFATVDQPNLRSHRLMLNIGYEVLGEGPGEQGPLVHYQRVANQ